MKTVEGKCATAAIYTDFVEEYAVAQVKQLCDQEAFAGCKVRVMPDVHPGKVGPIGFTSTVGEEVMPAVVGIDIGCGVTMARIRKGRVDFQKLDAVMRKELPSGFSTRKIPHRFAEAFDLSRLRCAEHVNEGRARLSLGTLGGGNHFVELDEGEGGDVFVVIHTGSRRLGKEVAEHYLAEGQKALKKSGRKAAYELTSLTGRLREDYLHDMAVVQEFASENRMAILDVITKGMKWKVEDVVDVAHNYVDFSGAEPVLRKGAISAKKGEAVIIPINMRDGVIVGRGLGNEEWNCSAPHGSGRILSREQARSAHTVSEFKKEMKGVHSASVGRETLDESPFAYRSLEDVLPLLGETVEVSETLRPIYNYKAMGGE